MEKVGSSNLVTGSCNSNFTQFRHLRYYDQKVTSCWDSFWCYFV